MSIFQWVANTIITIAVLFFVFSHHSLYWSWKFGPYRYCFHLRLTTVEGIVLKGRKLRLYKKLLKILSKLRNSDVGLNFRLAQEYNERARRYNRLMRHSGYIFATHQFLPPGEWPMRKRYPYIEINTLKPRYHV